MEPAKVLVIGAGCGPAAPLVPPTRWRTVRAVGYPARKWPSKLNPWAPSSLTVEIKEKRRHRIGLLERNEQEFIEAEMKLFLWTNQRSWHCDYRHPIPGRLRLNCGWITNGRHETGLGDCGPCSLNGGVTPLTKTEIYTTGQRRNPLLFDWINCPTGFACMATTCTTCWTTWAGPKI